MGTPLFMMGAEMGVAEADLTVGLPLVSSTKAYTGTYSFRSFSAGDVTAYSRAIPNTTELRARCMFNHNGNSTGAGGRHSDIITLVRSVGSPLSLQIDGGTTMGLFLSSTLLASIDISAISSWVVNTWIDVSVAFKASATVGFIRAYINGREVLAFAGNTNAGGIDTIRYGGGSVAAWNDFAYWDDCYAEDTTGEAAQPASSKRFYCGYANGNGSQSQLTGSDGNSVNNYQQVDDGSAPDDVTTYNEGASSGLQDLYTHATITLASGYSPIAYWPMIDAKKTNAGVATTIKIASRENSTTQLTSALSLTTAYLNYMQRYTLMPDGSAINMTKINNLEIGIETAGVYV